VIEDMPKPRLPYLYREKTRHDEKVWYVRRERHGPRIRIRAEYGTPVFYAEYQAALVGSRPKGVRESTAGTLAWLVERYRETSAWTSLSLATRRQRENILKHVLASAGGALVNRITAKHIADGRDQRKATPVQARHFLDTMRGIFRWAAEAQLIKSDPTLGIKSPKQKKTDGFVAWTEDDVAAYERRWPIGTRQRVWFDVLLYTGLRRGDAVLLGRQHVRDGIAALKTEKTGTPVTLPILPVLAKTLAAGPVGDLTFIVTDRGQPLSKEGFGNAFRKACRAAGVKKSAHGVRKIAATRAANAGATVAQLEAIFGWSSGRMASLYTATADRRRLALEAMHRLGEANAK
jgi:integrase